MSRRASVGGDEDHGHGFYRLMLRFGFLEETDVPETLAGDQRAARRSR